MPGVLDEIAPELRQLITFNERHVKDWLSVAAKIKEDGLPGSEIDWFLMIRGFLLGRGANDESAKDLAHILCRKPEEVRELLRLRDNLKPWQPDDKTLIDRAKELYEEEGELEFDDFPLISRSEWDEPPSGAYVACWRWVEFTSEEEAQVITAWQKAGRNGRS